MLESIGNCISKPVKIDGEAMISFFASGADKELIYLHFKVVGKKKLSLKGV